MGRLLTLAVRLAPSIANAAQRGSQLVVLWALANAAGGAPQAQLLAGFGLVATFVMISDSGAGVYLLARRTDELTRTTFARACGVQVAISALGVAACAAFLAIVLERPVSGTVVAVLAALALTQATDNLSRVVRYPLLNHGRETAFAWPELTCAVLKIGVAGWVGLSGDLLGLLAFPVVSLAVLGLALRQVRGVLLPAAGDPPATRAILAYGLAGAINATYSQLPLLFASLLLSNATAAVVATFMRVFQALEIVPGTLSLQMIPRYAAGRRGLGRDWVAMTGGAVLLALVFLPFLPLLGRLLDLDLPVALGALFAAAFVARCGGYLLSSFLMGTGRIDLRLRLTALAAVVMLPVAPLLVWSLGRPGAALAAVAAEVLLAAVFAQRLVRGTGSGDERAETLDGVAPAAHV